MVHQYRDVLAPFAQRRQRDRQHVQPVVEVLAELAFGDHLFEIALAAGDDADVHGNGARAAEPLDGAVLQHPQELHLHRQRHVVDVVEKDGAALGELEASRAILDGAGEGAALVSEQLRLDQRFREQRAAHRHKRVMLAAARLVDQRRRHLFPGAALAGDEDGAVAAADHAQEFEHRAHAGAAADDKRVRCGRCRVHGDPQIRRSVSNSGSSSAAPFRRRGAASSARWGSRRICP